MATEQSPLTAAERDYLLELFAEEAIGQPPTPETVSLRLESSGIEPDRLLRLLAGQALELTASDGRYRLRFGLEWGDPLHDEPTLRLVPPTVTDRLGVERQARVYPAADEVSVLDLDDQTAAPQVLNLSDTGIALSEASRRAQAQELRELELRLPGSPPLRVRGRVVRVDADQGPATVALSFESLSAETRNSLRQYVLSRYEVSG